MYSIVSLCLSSLLDGTVCCTVLYDKVHGPLEGCRCCGLWREGEEGGRGAIPWAGGRTRVT